MMLNICISKIKCRLYSIRITQLEDLFVYNRNEKSIQQIKSDVRDYERSVIERAQLLVQALLKEAEALRLQNEADKLKK